MWLVTESEELEEKTWLPGCPLIKKSFQNKSLTFQQKYDTEFEKSKSEVKQIGPSWMKQF